MKFAKNMPKWLDRYSAVALRYVLACLSAAALFLTASPASAWKMEVGEFISNQTYDAIPSFNTISFDQAYDTPPIVFVLPTTNGGHTAALRVRDITTTQFEVGVTEPTGFDGPHVDMRVRYLAIEPGVHTLPDGTIIEAGTVDTTAQQVGANFPIMGSWESISFTAGFTAPPALLTQVQTMVNESSSPPSTVSTPFLATTARAVTASGADLALERGEATQGSVTAPETIGYLAMSGGVDSNLFSRTGVSIDYESQASVPGIRRWSNGCTQINFSNTFPVSGRAFVSVVTRSESDGAWPRSCGNPTTAAIRVTLDEDTANDGERGGGTESVSLIAFGGDFTAEFDVPGEVDIAEAQVEVGDALTLRVEDSDLRNLALGTLDVQVRNLETMSAITVTLTETSPGVFEGSADTGAVGGGSTLGVEPGDTVQIEYGDTTPMATITDTAVVIGCADGIVNLVETCDDGNLSAGDGCDASCQTEPDYACPADGGACLTVDLTQPADGALTNDNPPTISGTATPGAQVQVEILDGGGASVFTRTVSAAGGTWGFTPGVLFGEGDFTLTATVTTTGGSATDTHTFTIDTTPPAVAIANPPMSGTTTGVDQPSINGTAEVGADVVVTLTDTGGVTVAAQSFPNTGGAWSLTPSPLADGLYDIEVVATDAAGNIATAASDITIDTSLPSVSITSPATAGLATQDVTPNIAGTAEPGTDVIVTLTDAGGATVSSQTFLGVGGTWGYNTTPLAEGSYTITATATDSGGNTSADVSEVRIDLTPPAVAITDPATVGAPTADTTPTISGTTEAGVTLEVVVRDAGGATVYTETLNGAPASWSVTPTSPLTDGDYTIEARATDAAGNDAVVFSGLEVDTGPPSVAITQPAAAGTSTADDTPQVRGTAASGSTVVVTIRDALGQIVYTETITGHGGSWSVTPPAPLADGVYDLFVEATDEVGNSAQVSSDVRVDTEGPIVSITSPADGATLVDATPTFAGTAGSDTSAADFTIYNSSNTIVLSVSLNLVMGDWTFTPVVGLPDGTYRAEVEGRDALGNASREEITFSVDTQTSLVIAAPADQSVSSNVDPDALGTGEPGASVEVRVFDEQGALVVFETVTVDAMGDWLADLQVMLSDGRYSLTASATDAVGNNASITHEFVVDTTALVQIDAPADGSTTSDTTPTIEGQAEAGASVLVEVRDVNGGVVASQTVTATGGIWSWTPTMALPAMQTLEVTATATDAVGNTGQDQIGFTVDASAPTITIDAPAGGSAVASQRPEIRGVADADADVELVIDGQAPVVVTADSNGDWTYTPMMDLPEGQVVVEATVTNAAGTSSSDSSTFTIDVTSPGLTLDPLPNGGVVSDARQPIRGETEPGATVTVTLPGGQTVELTADSRGEFTYTPSSDWAEGSVTVSVEAEDAAGNSSGDQMVTFEVDTTAPSVTIDVPADGARLADAQPTFEGTSEADASVTLALTDAQGGAVFTQVVTADVNEDWSYTPLFQLTDGDYVLTATAADEAGNTSEASVDFAIDTTAPALSIDSPGDGDATDEEQPSISGTTEPGLEVSVQIVDDQGDVVASQTVTADGAGAWSYTSGAALGDGDYTIEVSATDEAGNTASASSDFEVDTQAPLITIDTPAAGARISNVRPAISGKSEPSLQVELEVSGVNAGLVIDEVLTADASTGVWSYTPGVDLTDDDYTIDVIVTDAAGNTASAASTFIVDTTAPSITITGPANASSTSERAPEISGQTDAGVAVTVEFFDDTGQVVLTAQATVQPSGDWSATPGALLQDGTYTVRATAEDGLGNTASDAVTVTVDTLSPPVDIESPADGDLLGQASPPIEGTSEPGAEIVLEVRDVNDMIVLSDMVTADANGDWSVTPATPLGDGDYAATATASDMAGNSSEDTVGFTIDTTPPDVSIDDPADGAVSDMRDVTLAGTTEPGAQVTVEIADADGNVLQTTEVTADDMGDWSVGTEMPLADGDYTATATATDEAGNSSSQTSAFTIDSEDPNLSIQSPQPDEVLAEAQPTIQGTSDPDATITIVIDGGQPVEVTPDGMGNWSYTPEDPLADGEHTVEVTATRPNSREISASVTFVVDTTAPEVTVTAPGQDAVLNTTSPTIEGTSEPGSTVEVFIDGELVGTVTADEEGDWSYTLEDDQALEDGEHTASAQATDAVGNGPAESDPVTFTVDTTAPDLSVDTPEPGQTLEVDTPTIEGTAEPGATVEIFIDGELVGTVTADEEGDWSYTLEDDQALEDGDYELRATTRDDSGNEASSGAIPFTVDADVELTLTITSPTDGEVLEVATPVIEGEATAGLMLTVLLDDEPLVELTATEEGTWSHELTEEQALEPGEHTIAVEGVSADGDELAAGPITVTVELSDDGDGDGGTANTLEGGGCGCTSSGGRQGAPATLLLLGLGWLGLRRRRRRR